MKINLMEKNISGFSKLSKIEKINWLIKTYFNNDFSFKNTLINYWNSNNKLQDLHDEFVENTVSNFYLPLGVAPNFIINGKPYALPMAIEESSVIAAASKTAKYWSSRGGFKAEVLGMEKIGHVHFLYKGDYEKISRFIKSIKSKLKKSTFNITKKMESRGGGITSISLINKTNKLKNYFQLELIFNTVDSMGANFINSCLEEFAKNLIIEASAYKYFSIEEKNIEIVMSILSNYVPGCLVKASVSCLINDLEEESEMSKNDFCEKFVRAVNIAEIEPYRAVTHNKGIMNGVDALVLATGNDFRAVEAGVHAYASRNGTYSSLSKAWIENKKFNFELTIPLSIGTVGGIISIHPLVKWSLNLLDNPNSSKLMELIAVAGLAQNFGAIRSLITSGIQKGHMKMHLTNILNQLDASSIQKNKAIEYFKKNKVSLQAVSTFLNLHDDLL